MRDCWCFLELVLEILIVLELRMSRGVLSSLYILVYRCCRWKTNRSVRRRKRERKEEEKGGAERGKDERTNKVSIRVTGENFSSVSFDKNC